jgi:putative peptidoglycan lipid II flippase
VLTWAAFVVVGGIAQLAIQVPSLWSTGFRPRVMPDVALKDPGTRRIATLMAPATLGVAAVQINVVVNSAFASLVSKGAISWLSYAFRLMQLPIGVFGVAVGTTALTHLSRDAAAQDWDGLRATMQRGLRMVLFLTVPSTVGLALLGVPIIRLIYQHGRFPPHATVETANALAGYALGLVAYAAIKVVAPAFYALGRTRVPLIASVASVIANLIWNLLSFRRFGHVGLAIGTSLAAIVNFSVLAFAFQRSVGGLASRALLAPFARIVAASAVMAAVVWFVSKRVEAGIGGAGMAVFGVKAFLPIAAGALVYFGAARLFGVEEARLLVRRFRR